MSTIILIAGGTASGKTTITQKLSQCLDCVIIHHDRYYKDVATPKGHNYDEPQALDNTRLKKDLESLKNNQPTHIPIYDFPTHKRLQQQEYITPQKYIIVEGILTLAIPEILTLGDVCIYVEAPADIRLMRRIRRDTIQRGRSIESVLNQYEKTVRPMHNQYILPSKSKASLVINGCGTIKNSVEQIEEHIKKYSKDT